MTIPNDLQPQVILTHSRLPFYSPGCPASETLNHLNHLPKVSVTIKCAHPTGLDSSATFQMPQASTVTHSRVLTAPCTVNRTSLQL